MARYVLGNIKHTMTKRKRDHDTRVLMNMRAKHGTTVIVGNEIETSSAKKIWTFVAKLFRGKTYNTTSESPAAVFGSYWEVVKTSLVTTHSGRKMVTPTRKIAKLYMKKRRWP